MLSNQYFVDVEEEEEREGERKKNMYANQTTSLDNCIPLNRDFVLFAIEKEASDEIVWNLVSSLCKSVYEGKKGVSL